MTNIRKAVLYMDSCDFLTALWLSEDIAKRNHLSADESYRIFCSLRCGVPLPGARSRRKVQQKKVEKKPVEDTIRFVAGEKVGLSPDKAAMYEGDKYTGWVYRDKLSKSIKVV